MSNDPDQIRDDIELTRTDLSANVNALADSVRPGSVAKRQAEKVTGAVAGLKEKVMGSADDPSSSLIVPVSDAVDTAKNAAVSAPSKARQQTRGNPLAAGLIAFGAGWLFGSLLPASSAEQQAATTLKEKAAPVTEQVTQAAKDVAGSLQEPAQQAVEQVKSSASDAAQNVKEETKSSASDVKSASQDAVGEVKQQAGS